MTTRPEYVAWIERVQATYEAVSYTCAHRLRDWALGERVGVGVVSGLVSRPTVFRYQGLPYSGRIASIAEDELVAAREGRLGERGAWAELANGLAAVPDDVQEVIVLACVHGQDGDELATSLGCTAEEAARRRESAIAMLRRIAQGVGGVE